MITVYASQHWLHATHEVRLEGHPFDSYEVPARAERILAALQAANIGPVIEPVDHGLAPIEGVHDAEYVEFLQLAYEESARRLGEGTPVFVWTFANRHAARKPASLLGRKGFYAFGWGSPILAGTWQAAYWSAQCAVTAASLVRQGETTVYALCRPPGHHAAADLYGGYCYLNNAAIAARYLQEGDAQVAILDVDYHHGNGTQLIFYQDPAVLFCSLHAHPDEEYPYFWGDADERGAGAGLGTNHNWPLPLDTGQEDYLAALDGALSTVREYAPNYLIVSAGFDVVAGDPEGGFQLSTASLSEMGQRIAALGLPTVLVQEGGYLLEKLGENALSFLRPFAGREG
jgi:acetoin utilization deacetylase AcuC-like enzyme